MEMYENTLDKLIQCPDSYTGPNHPFKFKQEQMKELENAKIKERLLGNCSSTATSISSCESSDIEIGSDAQSMASLDFNSEDNHQAMPPTKRLGRGRGRPKGSKNGLSSRGSSLSRSNSTVSNSSQPDFNMYPQNGVYPGNFLNNNIPKELNIFNGFERASSPVGSLNSSISSNKKAAEKYVGRDEFFVLAQRNDSNGKLQYLVDWDEALD